MEAIEVSHKILKDSLTRSSDFSSQRDPQLRIIYCTFHTSTHTVQNNQTKRMSHYLGGLGGENVTLVAV